MDDNLREFDKIIREALETRRKAEKNLWVSIAALGFACFSLGFTLGMIAFKARYG